MRRLFSSSSIFRYDDWAYELGIIEFQDEQKNFMPIDNKNGGQGCAFVILFAIAVAFIYYYLTI